MVCFQHSIFDLFIFCVQKINFRLTSKESGVQFTLGLEKVPIEIVFPLEKLKFMLIEIIIFFEIMFLGFITFLYLQRKLQNVFLLQRLFICVTCQKRNGLAYRLSDINLQTNMIVSKDVMDLPLFRPEPGKLFHTLILLLSFLWSFG